MQSIVTCEYIIQSAFCSADEIDECILNLRVIKNALEYSAFRKPFLEVDILGKLIELGQFPSDKLINSNLCGIGKSIQYSSQDITTIIHTILEKGIEISEVSSNIVFDCKEVMADLPLCSLVSTGREDSFLNFMNFLAVYNDFSLEELCVLHPVSTVVVNIEASLVFSQILFDKDLHEDITIQTNFIFYKDYISYLSSLPELDLFNSFSCSFSLKLAIYIQAIRISIQSGKGYIDWNNFSIGDCFIESLNMHQSGANMNFGKRVFEVASSIIAGLPLVEINVFTKSINDITPRMKGDKTAYRVHVTKGGLGLRLMFWKSNDGFIELANVANKQELVIY